LYWLGLLLEEIISLKKESIDLLSARLQNKHFGVIQISEELLPVFRNYDSNDEVKTQKVVFVADPSEYFIRKFTPKGNSTKNNRLGQNRINMLVSKFKQIYFNQTGVEIKQIQASCCHFSFFRILT